MAFGIWGLGFGVWDLGFRVWGLGFRVFCLKPNRNYGSFRNLPVKLLVALTISGINP